MRKITALTIKVAEVIDINRKDYLIMLDDSVLGHRVKGLEGVDAYIQSLPGYVGLNRTQRPCDTAKIAYPLNAAEMRDFARMITYKNKVELRKTYDNAHALERQIALLTAQSKKKPAGLLGTLVDGAYVYHEYYE